HLAQTSLHRITPEAKPPDNWNHGREQTCGGKELQRTPGHPTIRAACNNGPCSGQKKDKQRSKGRRENGSPIEQRYCRAAGVLAPVGPAEDKIVLGRLSGKGQHHRNRNCDSEKVESIR